MSIKQAYIQGYSAYKEGKRIEDNPHVERRYMDAWKLGYMEARNV